MKEDIWGYVCYIVINEMGGVEFFEGIMIDNDILYFICKWWLGFLKYLIDEENIENFVFNIFLKKLKKIIFNWRRKYWWFYFLKIFFINEWIIILFSI